MKKIICAVNLLVLLILCGCTNGTENIGTLFSLGKRNIKDTRFMLDTFVTLEAQCSQKVLDGAFALCEKKEKQLSCTLPESEVSRLNSSSGFFAVSKDTEKIIRKAVYYSDLSGGRFDITVYPVSMLWDFNNEVIPDKKEIAEALKNVDYQSIAFSKNGVCLNGKKIDLGAIAKGFIADELLKYFKENNVKSGIINLGGNIITFGEKENIIGIKKPFSQNEISGKVKIQNKSIVTSGIYERYIEKDGKIYHHVLDTKTGYGVNSDLASATVICDSSLDGDALSTVCLLVGKDKAREIINGIENTEAVFITRDNEIFYTSGLLRDGDTFKIK